VLVAISKDMRAVKLSSNKISQSLTDDVLAVQADPHNDSTEKRLCVYIMIIIIIVIMNAGIYNDTAAEVLKERVARSYRGLEHIMSGC